MSQSYQTYILEQDDLCSCNNKYNIWTSDNSLKSMEKAGLFEEQTNILRRICCYSARSFTLNCQFKGDKYSVAICPMRWCFWQLGCCPPEMVITQKDVSIGKLTCASKCWKGQTNSWSGVLIHVTDSSGKCIYTIENQCCTLEYLIQITRLVTNQAVQYVIKDASGSVIGNIKNLNISCCLTCFTDQDKFSISFQRSIPSEHKKLLMNSVVFIDFLKWESY